MTRETQQNSHHNLPRPLQPQGGIVCLEYDGWAVTWDLSPTEIPESDQAFVSNKSRKMNGVCSFAHPTNSVCAALPCIARNDLPSVAYPRTLSGEVRETGTPQRPASLAPPVDSDSGVMSGASTCVHSGGIRSQPRRNCRDTTCRAGTSLSLRRSSGRSASFSGPSRQPHIWRQSEKRTSARRSVGYRVSTTRPPMSLWPCSQKFLNASSR
jgi:hypothetical protein